MLSWAPGLAHCLRSCRPLEAEARPALPWIDCCGRHTGFGLLGRGGGGRRVALDQLVSAHPHLQAPAGRDTGAVAEADKNIALWDVNAVRQSRQLLLKLRAPGRTSTMRVQCASPKSQHGWFVRRPVGPAPHGSLVNAALQGIQLSLHRDSLTRGLIQGQGTVIL